MEKNLRAKTIKRQNIKEARWSRKRDDAS